MSVYLIPDQGDFEIIVDALKRVGATIVVPDSLRSFILATNEKPLCVSTLSIHDLRVLQRHASTLVDEVPSTLLNVPGLIYSYEWQTVCAGVFPAIDWPEFEKKVATSGTLAVTPGDMEKRDRGVMDAHSLNRGIVTSSQRSPSRAPRSTYVAPPMPRTPQPDVGPSNDVDEDQDGE